MPSAASLLSVGTWLSLPGEWKEREQGKETQEISKGERWRNDYVANNKRNRGGGHKILRRVLFQIRKLYLASVADQRNSAFRWVQLGEVLHPCFHFASSLKHLLHILTQSGGHCGTRGSFWRCSWHVFIIQCLGFTLRSELSWRSNILCPPPNPLNCIASSWNLNEWFGLSGHSCQI